MILNGFKREGQSFITYLKLLESMNFETQSEIDQFERDDDEVKIEKQGLVWHNTEILPNTEQAMLKKQKLMEIQKKKDMELLQVKHSKPLSHVFSG